MKRRPPGETLEVFFCLSSDNVRCHQMKKLLLPLLLLPQPAFAAEEALIICRQIEETAKRVACYDEVVDSHFQINSSNSGDTTTAPEKAESSVVPEAQSLFGKNDAEAKRIVETSLAIEQISEIEAVVTDVRKSASKKLTVSLDNGQIWRQLDNQPLLLKNGEAVVIRKASLGSFLMEKKTGGRSIRVKRAN